MGEASQTDGLTMHIGRPTTHDNHYVPEATLKRWAGSGGRVNTYALLVPHANVPVWRSYQPSAIASQLDLYSRSSQTEAEDEFEHWLTHTYEEDGQNAIAQLVERGRMRPADWGRISMFVAVQQLRTPLAFREFAARYPELIQEALKASVEDWKVHITEARRAGVPMQSEPRPDHLSGVLRVVLDRNHSQGMAAFYTEIASLRSVWMAEVRRLLQEHEHLITRTCWQTMVPAGDDEWLLTDHPALNVAYYDPERYDFKGGWGQSGADFVLPIHPRLALYTRIGQRKTGRFEATPELSQLVQRLLVERAFRWIFACGKPQWVETLRPRTVDVALHGQEEEMRARWHPEQAAMEAEFAALDSEASKRLAQGPRSVIEDDTV